MESPIANGKVTIKLDAPNPFELDDISNFYPGIDLAPASDAKYFSIGQFTESTRTYVLSCIGLDRGVSLFYVDKSVTLNGTHDGNIFNNVILQAGWNYLIIMIDNNGDIIYSAARTLPAGYNWTIED